MPSSNKKTGLFSRLLVGGGRPRAWRESDARTLGTVTPGHGTSATRTTRSGTRGISLAELTPGEQGIVQVFTADSHRRLQLMEMGLTPGTQVTVLRAAAFGGPLDLALRGYRLSLRRDEAEAILVTRDTKR